MGNRARNSFLNTETTPSATETFTTIRPWWTRPSNPQYRRVSRRRSRRGTGQPGCHVVRRSFAANRAVNGHTFPRNLAGNAVGVTWEAEDGCAVIGPLGSAAWCPGGRPPTGAAQADSRTATTPAAILPPGPRPPAEARSWLIIAPTHGAWSSGAVAPSHGSLVAHPRAP